MTYPDSTARFLTRICSILLLLIPFRAHLFPDSLSSDDRIGKIADSQGIVAVKGVVGERWTPVCEKMLLKPGDWIRTDPRGANAVEVRLTNQTRLILGPGTLVELAEPTQVRLVNGELEVAAPGGTTVQLLAPGGAKEIVEGTQVFRVRDEKLTRLTSESNWLQGFKGAIVTESMGSLLANVEGRNVPLTVGYHKVTVDLRDQIARTVIEESFVNHTNGTLEGVFYFPLPQDASISGFGMWIGDQLVEADVVEKERAREIYETILREQRDPGLLEWEGGNIFKARVFPIWGGSEKRIKITYTQVLPLKGSAYRYSYALQSELLKQHPLRELAIDVKVNSALPLKSVTCPTHETRLDRTDHSAHVEFSAQEYTPKRDFEVEIEVDRQHTPVALIPHRRGEDGYFLLLLTPPDAGDAWQRDVLPNSDPVEFLVLADTSGSMDRSQRKSQDEFIAALLSSLSRKDSFNLATCDVTCEWLRPGSVPATESNISAARDFLAARRSLGWTDLDRAFASVLEHTGPNTHVVYVGDGVVTTRDAAPVAFGKRLKRLYANNSADFHTVATGSSFEPAVMKDIASLGGGSFRRIQGADGPQKVAYQLLSEITRPALRDLKVEFKGFRAARIYPEELPNLTAGAQQILLGRYLPEGRDLQGEVVVTGVRDGKRVQFRSPVSFADDEKGNSFIPRLWARTHLDYLLDQGRTPEIKDEVIALSEEFQIMTPYTSFLVLESDADRERFGVKRRFRMRDGERFFAEGRDAASYELVQKQMQRAGNWRLGLRRNVLQELSLMGRFQFATQRERGFRVQNDMLRASSAGKDGDYALPYSLSGSQREAVYDGFGDSARKDEAAEEKGLAQEPPPPATEIPDDRWAYDGNAQTIWADFKGLVELPQRAASAERSLPAHKLSVPAGLSSIVSYDPQNWLVLSGASGPTGPMGLQGGDARSIPLGLIAQPSRFGGGGGGLGGFGGEAYTPNLYWLQQLFPYLSVSSSPPVPMDTKMAWPAAVRELAESLLRKKTLTAPDGGIEVVCASESYDVRQKQPQLTNVSQTLALYSPAFWLTRTTTDTTQTFINWCDSKERGVLSRLFLLGRTRGTVPADLENPPLPLDDYSLTSLEFSYQGATPTIEKDKEGAVVLKLIHPSNASYQTRLRIDTKRHVLLSREAIQDGKVTSITTFKDFVEVAGSWWATTVESTDAVGLLLYRKRLSIKELNAQAFALRLGEELAPREKAILIHEPLPPLPDAKQAVAEGKATFDDRLVLIAHFVQSQQWTRVDEHLEKAEKLVEGKPGFQWLQNSLLNLSRRHDDLKQRLLGVARSAARKPAPDELFLANAILSQASGLFQANELLDLLDVLKPVYARQEQWTNAMKQWRQQRGNYLQSAGRGDESFPLWQDLAREFPLDQGVQSQYVSALWNRGEAEAAYRWLDQLLEKKDVWDSSQWESLFRQYLDLLQNQGRRVETVKLFERWMDGRPMGADLYQRYLHSLIRLGKDQKTDRLTAQWMKEGQLTGKLSPEVSSRLQAAVNRLLGTGYYPSDSNYYSYNYRLDEKWFEALGELVRFFARHETQSQIAEQIMGCGQFQQSDTCRALRREFTKTLLDRVAELKPIEIQRFVSWITPNDPAVERETWKQIAAGIERRWEAEKEADLRHQLGQTLVQGLSRAADAPEQIAFLRRQWMEGPRKYVDQDTNQHFEALLNQPWSEKYETEAFSLLGKLSSQSVTDEQRAAQVIALHRLMDRMFAARAKAGMEAIAHQENLSRTELKKIQDEALRKSREGLVTRLQEEAEKQPASLKPWINIERIYLEAQLAHPPRPLMAECWEYLGAEPPGPVLRNEAKNLDAVLIQRYLQTLEYLAVRPKADPELGRRVLAYIDKAMAKVPHDTDWQYHKYRLLIALDKPEELEQALRSWIRPGEVDSTWRITLGYLLAERNRIPEAIKRFEAIESADELGPAEYRVLADWYMAVNDKAKHQQAQLAELTTESEDFLNQRLYRCLQPWQRRQDQMPRELDPEVIRLFTALFHKATSPNRYLYQLQQFYQYSHDFRLLECLAEGVVGHSAEQVYPFLLTLRQVLNEIRDEATADSVVERLDKVRERAKTTVDRRALDLLEVEVKRRASEIKNQPGQYTEAVLSALRRAFKGDWATGERRLMADFLANLGAMAQPPLAEEQLRQLKELHREEKQGSVDRFHIAYRWATTLWGYSRWDDAIDLLESSLTEFREANGGRFANQCNEAFGTLVSYLETRGHFARAEKTVMAELDRPASGQQKFWLAQRLFQVYNVSLKNGGEVSLGSGQTLYNTVKNKLMEAMNTNDHSHRAALVNQLCSFYRTAVGKKMEGVVSDLKAFALKDFLSVLERQTNNYQDLVGSVAGTLHDLAGPKEGLTFLIERIENEPDWLRYENKDGWQTHCYQLAEWRPQAGVLGDLELRLLKLVLRELRSDLESQRSRNRYIYDRHSSFFWEEKAGDFAKETESAWTERKQSGAAVKYIAEYLYEGISRYSRAIEILFDAHKREILDEGGQAQLVNYLHGQHRYAESVPLLRDLVRWRSDNLGYRVQLMHAYFQTKNPEDLHALLKQTDAYFHEKKWWTENTIATLAQSCLTNQLYTESVAYYREVIPLHQRTQPNRGIGKSTLSYYYSYLSRACAGLKQTADAVEAAAGAVVSWGSNTNNRRDALSALKQVLASAPDLEGYVRVLDKQVAESGLESPIIRKALGQVYLDKREYRKAIEQLRLAVQAQPNDAETYTALVKAYDQQNDKEGAVLQLLESAELSRRDIALFKDLGRRLTELGKMEEAERAVTSIVESLPNESESHAMLAEIRQQQNRWDDAILHWQQVARIRSLEPTGLLKLAEAQIHQKQKREAKETLELLLKKDWPERFGEVHAQVRQMMEQVE